MFVLFYWDFVVNKCGVVDDVLIIELGCLFDGDVFLDKWFWIKWFEKVGLVEIVCNDLCDVGVDFCFFRWCIGEVGNWDGDGIDVFLSDIDF